MLGATLGFAEGAAAEGAAAEGAAAEAAADGDAAAVGALEAWEEHPATSAPTTSVESAALASLINGTCRLSIEGEGTRGRAGIADHRLSCSIGPPPRDRRMPRIGDWPKSLPVSLPLPNGTAPVNR